MQCVRSSLELLLLHPLAQREGNLEKMAKLLQDLQQGEDAGKPLPPARICALVIHQRERESGERERVCVCVCERERA
jgi:hypothetical protein